MGLLNDDMKARFRQAQAQQNPAQAEEKQLDVEEYYRLQAKMLGVLIRDARLSAARTEAECARIMGISQPEYEAWEFGDTAPSLPQLEILAFYLGVPVSHFWGQNTLRDEYAQDNRAEAEYINLRTRMVGILLRQAREDAGKSVDEVAEDAKLPVASIQAYESGEAAVPMHELNVLARSVNKTMPYFIESSGTIGELLAAREEWKHFAELPDDIRAFAANPLNIGFIEIAVMLSQMPADKLRNVGRSIVDITM